MIFETGEIKQILYTCTATLIEQERLDDCISAKVGKQMKTETLLHQRQQYGSRESFMGLAYVDCSGVGACLSGGQRSMAGRAEFGIKLSLQEMVSKIQKAKEKRAIAYMESTAVKIFVTLSSFKPVSLFSSRISSILNNPNKSFLTQ